MYNKNMRKLEFEYKIEEEKTLEQYFKYFCLGKEKINFLIFGGFVKVNGEIINSKEYVLTVNDKLSLELSVPNVDCFQKEIDVLYEDEYILVVNKRSGILVHPDGKDNKTLQNVVYNYLKQNKCNLYAYPVHRIDYDTTGIVVFAKDPLMLSFLCSEIEKHNLLKEYVCLCHNKFNILQGKIDKKIGKNRHKKGQIISNGGKESETYYQVIKNGVISKVKVKITHGRRHQIRVHMSSINHPIVGDSIYGIGDNEKLKLHFKKVELYHPFRKEKILIKCEEEF